MAKTKTELAWTEIDPASLPEVPAGLYAEYKAAYRLMKDARGAFEGSLQGGAPEGKRIVCGYNFGKLSLALAEAEAVRVKQGVGNLAAFLSQAQARGDRS